MAVKTAVPNHRKTARLARLLGIPRAYAVGLVTCVWNYAKQYAKDGDISRISSIDWEDALGVEDGQKIIQAMRDSDWLDDHPGGNGFVIHDWLEHCEGYIIRDLQAVGRLPENWKRGSAVPARLYVARQSTTTHEPVRRSTTTHGAAVLTRGEVKGRTEGKGALERGPGKTTPPVFDSPPMQAAWDEWVQHRRESGKKLTPSSAKKQIAVLLDWGEARAVAAIQHSIERGWQGIYEPKDDRDGKRKPADRTAGHHAEPARPVPTSL